MNKDKYKNIEQLLKPLLNFPYVQSDHFTDLS